MALGREQILDADDSVVKEVKVPEWRDPKTGEETVLVKALSGKERANYLGSIMQIRGTRTEPNMANLQAKLCARSIVDEKGQRVFSDADINALGEKSGAALERVFSVASEISGLSDQDIADAVGKSESTPSDDSTSA